MRFSFSVSELVYFVSDVNFLNYLQLQPGRFFYVCHKCSVAIDMPPGTISVVVFVLLPLT